MYIINNSLNSLLAMILLSPLNRHSLFVGEYSKLRQVKDREPTYLDLIKAFDIVQLACKYEKDFLN